MYKTYSPDRPRKTKVLYVDKIKHIIKIFFESNNNISYISFL